MSVLIKDPDGSTPSPGMRRGDFLRQGAVAGAALTGAGALVAEEARAGGKSRAGGASPAHSPLDRGLHARINKISHVVVNVSDLERAKAFWERWTPLRAYARTQAPRQPFRSLGIDSGQFDGYLLADEADAGSIYGGGLPPSPHEFNLSFHLVEWKDPKPVGRPYDRVNNVGWYRLATQVAGRSVQQQYDALVAAGLTPFTPPAPDFPVIGLPDPDGIVLEYLPATFPVADRLSHIASSTTDPTRTALFYRDLVGIDFTSRAGSCPVTNTLDAHGGRAGYDVAWFRARGYSSFTIDRLSWHSGASTVGAVYAEPNHIGFTHMAFEVDDIEAAYRALVEGARAWKKTKVRIAGPPEEWDFGPEIGKLAVVVFTDPDGVGHQLIQASAYPQATLEPPPLDCSDD